MCGAYIIVVTSSSGSSSSVSVGGTSVRSRGSVGTV